MLSFNLAQPQLLQLSENKPENEKPASPSPVHANGEVEGRERVKVR